MHSHSAAGSPPARWQCAAQCASSALCTPTTQARSPRLTTRRLRCSSVAMRSVKLRPSVLWYVTKGRASAPPADDSSTGVSTSRKSGQEFKKEQHTSSTAWRCVLRAGQTAPPRAGSLHLQDTCRLRTRGQKGMAVCSRPARKSYVEDGHVPASFGCQPWCEGYYPRRTCTSRPAYRLPTAAPACAPAPTVLLQHAPHG